MIFRSLRVHRIPPPDRRHIQTRDATRLCISRKRGVPMAAQAAFVFNLNNLARVSGVWGYASLAVLAGTLLITLVFVVAKRSHATKWLAWWLVAQPLFYLWVLLWTVSHSFATPGGYFEAGKLVQVWHGERTFLVAHGLVQMSVTGLCWFCLMWRRGSNEVKTPRGAQLLAILYICAAWLILFTKDISLL